MNLNNVVDVHATSDFLYQCENSSIKMLVEQKMHVEWDWNFVWDDVNDDHVDTSVIERIMSPSAGNPDVGVIIKSYDTDNFLFFCFKIVY